MPIKQFYPYGGGEGLRRALREALRLEGVPKAIRERVNFNGAMPGNGVALGSITYPYNRAGGQSSFTTLYKWADARELTDTLEGRKRLADWALYSERRYREMTRPIACLIGGFWGLVHGVSEHPTAYRVCGAPLEGSPDSYTIRVDHFADEKRREHGRTETLTGTEREVCERLIRDFPGIARSGRIYGFNAAAREAGWTLRIAEREYA